MSEKVSRRSARPIALFIGALAMWEAVVRVFDIKGFILPAPSAIVSTFASRVGSICGRPVSARS